VGVLERIRREHVFVPVAKGRTVRPNTGPLAHALRAPRRPPAFGYQVAGEGPLGVVVATGPPSCRAFLGRALDGAGVLVYGSLASFARVVWFRTDEAWHLRPVAEPPTLEQRGTDMGRHRGPPAWGAWR